MLMLSKQKFFGIFSFSECGKFSRLESLRAADLVVKGADFGVPRAWIWVFVLEFTSYGAFRFSDCYLENGVISSD